MNYYTLDNHLTRIHVYMCEGDAVSQEEAGEGQRGLRMDR